MVFLCNYASGGKSRGSGALFPHTRPRNGGLYKNPFCGGISDRETGLYYKFPTTCGKLMWKNAAKSEIHRVFPRSFPQVVENSGENHPDILCQNPGNDGNCGIYGVWGGEFSTGGEKSKDFGKPVFHMVVDMWKKGGFPRCRRREAGGGRELSAQDKNSSDVHLKDCTSGEKCGILRV